MPMIKMCSMDIYYWVIRVRQVTTATHRTVPNGHTNFIGVGRKGGGLSGAVIRVVEQLNAYISFSIAGGARHFCPANDVSVAATDPRKSNGYISRIYYTHVYNVALSRAPTIVYTPSLVTTLIFKIQTTFTI